jgi:xanthine dehydrogenase/oxidase
MRLLHTWHCDVTVRFDQEFNDPVSKEFHISANDIELEGHLDGNLCRCTGYKPILQAAKTFITEDLKGKIASSPALREPDTEAKDDSLEILYQTESNGTVLPKNNSCGRLGGCCRDSPEATSCGGLASGKSPSRTFDGSSDSVSLGSGDSESPLTTPDGDSTSGFSGTSYGKVIKSSGIVSNDTQVEGTKITNVDAPPPKIENGVPQYSFAPYSPHTELIFPPALRKYEKTALYYGNYTHVWFLPVNLEQLLLIKDSYPSSKLVGGSSEVQVEVRFKHSSFPISVYVSDVEELRRIEYPEGAQLRSMKELVLGANAPLTNVERVCKELYAKLGQQASVLEAVRKQLRYFAGRQIRNVASFAGNIATASPISDLNPVLIASGATLTAQSLSKGKMSLPMSTFFTGYRTTALPTDAVILNVRVPLGHSGAREIKKAYKQAKRKDDDIAIVTAAFRVKLDEQGLVSDVSLSYGGMASKTVEALVTMKKLHDKKWHSSATLNGAIESLLEELDLKYDVPGGMATYRKTLAISLFFRFWHETIADLKLGEVDPDLITEIHRGISTGARDNFNPHEQRIVGK